MIDASRSPNPVWKRVFYAVLLVTAIVLAAWVIWVKELHHPGIQIRVLAPPVVVIVSQAVVPTS
jgi:hypothetical protein